MPNSKVRFSIALGLDLVPFKVHSLLVEEFFFQVLPITMDSSFGRGEAKEMEMEARSFPCFINEPRSFILPRMEVEVPNPIAIAHTIVLFPVPLGPIIIFIAGPGVIVHSS